MGRGTEYTESFSVLSEWKVIVIFVLVSVLFYNGHRKLLYRFQDILEVIVW